MDTESTRAYDRAPRPRLPVPTARRGLERQVGLDNVLRAVGIDRPSTRCGRYELLDKLGEGGMGVVYRARDPELDRELAIKLLREETGEAARARLRREALALARLSDPRVVTVFAVGHERGQTWIAMELVRGRTLATWANETGDDVGARRPRALAILLEAGAGLAAAHAAGLVHRDFKPANVLLGDDGGVKIADFGLAQSIEQQRTMSDGDHDEREHAEARVTAWAGTPRYMAPEQHAGSPADVRSDQYAFAVTAWEILAGTPPFCGPTLPRLLIAKQKGRVEGGGTLPGHVRRALLRAMRPAPHERFADIRQLLDAISGERSTRTWMVGAVGGCVALASALWPGDAPHPCAQLEPPGWTDAQRDSLRAAFVRDADLDATEAWSKLDGSFGEYAGRWMRERDLACASAPSDRAPAIATCLDDAARAFDEALALTVADPVAASSGSGIVAALPSLLCDADAPPQSKEHREIRAALSSAALLRAAGDYARELELLEPLGPRARALGDRGLLVRVLVAIADARSRGGAAATALPLLEEAHALAIETRDDTLAMDAALSAVTVLLGHGDTPSRVEGWLEHARVAHARLGRPITCAAVWLWIHEAELARWVDSDYERAAIAAEKALALAEQLDPEVDAEAWSTRVMVHAVLADHHLATGDVAKAEIHARLVLELRIERLGADHPETKEDHSYLSDVLLGKGEYREAMAALDTAIEGARASHGGESTEVAILLIKLATLHRFLGEPERALERAREALRILEASDASPMMITEALAPLSTAQQAVGDLEAARATGERIVRIVEADLGPHHFDLAPALYNLGDVLLDMDQREPAEAHYRRSLEIAQAALGDDSPNLAYPLSGLGEVALLSGRPEEARPLLARAAALAAEHHDARLTARIQWALARATTDDDPSAAAVLASEARDVYAAAEVEDRVAEIDAWLAAGAGRARITAR